LLGTAGGGIDGGQWQLPMPQMIITGAITNGRKVPMYILAMLSYPYKSLSLWFLLESMRWKFYPAQLPSVAAAKALDDKVTREDLWKKAATELGVPAKEIPKGSSRGSERLFDGVVYDPTKPQAYLDSLKIKR